MAPNKHQASQVGILRAYKKTQWPGKNNIRGTSTRKEGERTPETTMDTRYCGPPAHVIGGGWSTRTRQRGLQGGSEDNVLHRTSHIEEEEEEEEWYERSFLFPCFLLC